MSIFDCSISTATSDTAWVYSDAIDTTKRHLAGRNVSVKCDISGSAVSGLVDLTIAWSESSGGTYANFYTSLGTSKILNAGTSVGGIGANGSYLLPLFIKNDSGVTERLQAGGFYKVGTKASNYNSPVNLKFIVH